MFFSQCGGILMVLFTKQLKTPTISYCGGEKQPPRRGGGAIEKIFKEYNTFNKAFLF